MKQSILKFCAVIIGVSAAVAAIGRSRHMQSRQYVRMSNGTAKEITDQYTPCSGYPLVCRVKLTSCVTGQVLTAATTVYGNEGLTMPLNGESVAMVEVEVCP